jgi:hypothetical protein
MADQGSGGAFEISQRMTAMLGWGATSNFKEDWTWNQAAETYVMDPEMAGKLRKNNPQVKVSHRRNLIRNHVLHPLPLHLPFLYPSTHHPLPPSIKKRKVWILRWQKFAENNPQKRIDFPHLKPRTAPALCLPVLNSKFAADK